jgi:hypothetical protein
MLTTVRYAIQNALSTVSSPKIVPLTFLRHRYTLSSFASASIFVFRWGRLTAGNPLVFDVVHS